MVCDARLEAPQLLDTRIQGTASDGSGDIHAYAMLRGHAQGREASRRVALYT